MQEGQKCKKRHMWCICKKTDNNFLKHAQKRQKMQKESVYNSYLAYVT